MGDWRELELEARSGELEDRSGELEAGEEPEEPEEPERPVGLRRISPTHPSDC